MEFFKKETNIGFMALRRVTACISILMCLASFASLYYNGLNLGLDFTGGMQVEVRYPHAVTLETMRQALAKVGFDDAKVKHYGSPHDVLIRAQIQKDSSEQKMVGMVKTALNSVDSSLELRRVEFVGSEVGEKLLEEGGLAILVGLLATMLYIAMRFEYRFAVSSAVALLHDPILILGIFSFLHIDYDLPTLAAMLAVLGYSLNDTIVVFDRVRENFRTIRKRSAVEIMDLSINQTLSRTIMTSGLTLLVVIALLLYGGDTLYGFSLALCIGIVVGTYSSIYVAGATAIAMGLDREDLLPKSQTDLADDLP